MRRFAIPNRWLSLAMALLVLSAGGTLATAQETSPLAGNLEIVASGLTNPRGLAWNANDELFVALAGSGGATPGNPPLDTPPGPYRGGPTSAVARIDAGCPVAVLTGFPSSSDGQGGITGAADVAILGDTLYVVGAGGGDFLGNPGSTNGVYRVEGDGSTTLIADYSAWLQSNPPLNSPPEGFPNFGNPFSLVGAFQRLWMVDSLNGLVVTVMEDGTITLIADLSEGHPVLTGLALSPDGGVYVGTLTAAPYTDGSARVILIGPDGTISDVWTGLTAVTGVALGPDAFLYAVEMSTSNTDAPPYFVPGSGRIVRQTGPDTSEVVAEGLMFPVGLAVGPGDGLYTSLPGLGAEDGSGVVARVDLLGTGPLGTGSTDCEPIAETLFTAASAEEEEPASTPAATPEPSPESVAQTDTSEETETPEEGVVQVSLSEFVIDMPDELPAGRTTFEVTNDGTMPHNLLIVGPRVDVSFEQNLQPGETGSYTVNLSQGIYTVYCPVGNHRGQGMELSLKVT
jgi:hypothetical protein